MFNVMSRFCVSTILLAALSAFAPSPTRAGGTLVIVGGALEPDNRAVFEAFIGALPRQGPVVIVPAASASPASSARYFSDQLERYGLDPDRLLAFPLAVLDDETTPEVDERTWAGNAWDTKRVADLGEPAGFWFTGGDQIRIMEAMTRGHSEPSPLLKLIRERLAAGAVVGGTSAGAAMMSHHMIAGGSSPTAVLAPVVRNYHSTDEVEEGRLLLSTGAGFLPAGLVDQHFVSRPRLGRLIRALAETGECFGYGIGEDTAMVVDLDDKWATVLGRGVVVLVDISGASLDFDSNMPARGVAITYASAKARFPLRQCEPSRDLGFSVRTDLQFGFSKPGTDEMSALDYQ